MRQFPPDTSNRMAVLYQLSASLDCCRVAHWTTSKHLPSITSLEQMGMWEKGTCNYWREVWVGKCVLLAWKNVCSPSRSIAKALSGPRIPACFLRECFPHSRHLTSKVLSCFQLGSKHQIKADLNLIFLLFYNPAVWKHVSVPLQWKKTTLVGSRQSNTWIV